MSGLLQQAIDALKIQDVYQLSLVAVCSPGFDPKYHDHDDLVVQSMHLIRRSELLVTESDEGPDRVFRVIVSLGVRWIPVNEDEHAAEESPEELEALARIECMMVAEYEVKKDVSSEALQEFAKQNSSYHIWPYWREIVSSQCTKMNLPKVVLPMIQVASNQNDDSVEINQKGD